MPGKVTLFVVKIGGNIIDDDARLDEFLRLFAALPGAKILVHGGGKLATELAESLGVSQVMIEGRRVTDEATLKIAEMVYGGLVNKQLVAALHPHGCTAIGVCGADGDLLRAHKRKHPTIDFGLVGDIDTVNAPLLDRWLGQGLTPVIAPLSHDGEGQLFNTNADTIAQEIARAMSQAFHVVLIYGFEKNGVLLDVNNDNSCLRQIDFEEFQELKRKEIITRGMIPKLENAFSAIKEGVRRVIIGKAELLPQLIDGTSGTSIIRDRHENN
jgi:acetylglutamate kinase